MKVYEKFGKQFKIIQFSKPADGEIVYFRQDEYSWIQDQEKLWTPSQREVYFLFLWNAKLNDPWYQLLPDAPEVNSIANLYAEQIKEMLRKK